MTTDNTLKVVESTNPDVKKEVKSKEKHKNSGDSRFVKLKSIFHGGQRIAFDINKDPMKNTLFKVWRRLEKTNFEIFQKFDDGWLDKSNYEPDEIESYAKMYNKEAEKHKEKRVKLKSNPKKFGDWGLPYCTASVAGRIVDYASDGAVPRPKELNNHYASFSSETYGETNYTQLISIIDELGITEDDVFVDLGSGIGKLVCFTAAYAQCKKSVGIELSEVPAGYATKVGQYFKSLMAFFGKECGEFELHQGDMLDQKFRKLILEEATVIFINNIQFDEKLLLRIKTELLQHLNQGVRIVTTKALGKYEEITRRNATEFNALSVTVPMKTVKNNVSWTNKIIPFYCTTMDQSRLFEFYNANKSTSPEKSESKKRSNDSDDDLKSKKKKV